MVKTLPGLFSSCFFSPAVLSQAAETTREHRQLELAAGDRVPLDPPRRGPRGGPAAVHVISAAAGKASALPRMSCMMTNVQPIGPSAGSPTQAGKKTPDVTNGPATPHKVGNYTKKNPPQKTKKRFRLAKKGQSLGESRGPEAAIEANQLNKRGEVGGKRCCDGVYP